MGGSVLDVGLISFFKKFVQVLAAMLWARWIEKKGRCKVFILISFLVSSLTVFLFTVVDSMWSFLSLNILLSIFYVAHVRARSVLTVESFPSSEWMSGVAGHSLVVGLSGVVGLLVGALWTTRWNNRSLMPLCSVLVLVSLFLSMVLIRDPPLMIERRIMRWDRFVHLVEVTSNLIYAPVNYAPIAEKRYLTRFPRPKPLMAGSFLFPLASSLVLTPIPIFLSVKMGIPSWLIFCILLIQSATILIGYTVIRMHNQNELSKTIKTASILGILFPLLILISAVMPSHLSLTLTIVALAMAGFAWSNFSAVSTVLWTKSAPKDTAGIYRAVRILGAALGSLLGGFIPLYYGFQAVFTVSAVISGISLFFFSFQAHQQW